MSIAKARNAKAQKTAQTEEKNISQAKNLFKNRLSAAKQENTNLKSELIQLKEEIKQYQNQKQLSTNTILSDLLQNEDRKNYSDETFGLAMEIKAISPKAYSLLCKNLNFPPERLVEEKIKQIIGSFPEELTNINDVTKIVDKYKTKIGVKKSEPIDACLSVDAICFTPNVKITNDSQIYGIQIDPKIEKFTPNNIYKLFTEDPETFEKFINLNYENLIKAAFVFQIQPYHVDLKPFIVHIHPTVNGKANAGIIEILHQIREIVKNRHINIKSLAFDGDNAYLELHRMYYESYIHSAIKKEMINVKKTQVIRIVSDYLHILKRLRYRLLNCIVCAGFDSDATQIILEDLQTILDSIPPVVWCNEPYTKMHDKLPLELFKIEHFLKLFEENHFAAAAFWYPIALSLTAISTKDIGFQNRLFLLETSFWFLAFYKDNLDNFDNVTLRQRKYGEAKEVTFYTNELLIEFTNTLYSHIQLMCTIEEFCFDRNGTTPLEHKFGYARCRAHDVHTLKKFLRTISCLQTVEEVKSSIFQIQNNAELVNIHCRTNSVGVSVEPADLDEDLFLVFADDEDGGKNFAYSPQTCAKAILAFAGFDFPYTHFIDPGDVFNWLIPYLSELSGDIPTKRRKERQISSNTIKLGVKQYSRAYQLIKQSNEKPSKKTQDECRSEELYKLLYSKFGEDLRRYHLIKVLQAIKENDPDGPNPPISGRKQQMIDFLKRNLHLYYLFICDHSFE